jgi:valyl-tRNA synthetase
MKDRALISAEIYKIKADQERQLASLETTKAQLVDQVKASGMEADKWMFDSVSNITQQIQTIRDNYDIAAATNLQNYVMKPMLDIFS